MLTNLSGAYNWQFLIKLWSQISRLTESPKLLFNASLHNFGIAWSSWNHQNCSLTVKLYSYFHCTENHIFSFQTSRKDGLSKKIALEYDLSCIIGKDDISFSQKYDLTPRRKMKDDLSQKKYTEIWYFLQKRERWPSSSNTRKHGIFYLICSTPHLPKKKSKMILSRKNTPKGDWHLWSTP